MRVLKTHLLVVLFSVIFSCATMPSFAVPSHDASKPQITTTNAARILHFPPEISCGWLDLDQTPGDEIVPSAKKRNAAFKQVEARGDVKIPPNTRVSLRCAPIMLQKPESLNNLNPDDLLGLSFKRLGFMDSCDNIMGPISRLTGLKWLDLTGCELSDNSCKQLKTLKKLRILHIWMANVTGTFLSELKDAKDLELLDIGQNPLRPEVFKLFSQFPKLKLLNVSRSRLSDAQMSEIAKCKSLEELRMSQTAVTSKGFALLRNLPKLQSLDVVRTSVGLKDILQLKGLPLKSLMVSNYGHVWTPQETKMIETTFPGVRLQIKQGKVDSDTNAIFAPIH